MPVVFALQIKRFGGDHSIDAAYLIADFPTDLKKVVRFDKFIFHLLNNLLIYPGGIAMNPPGEITILSFFTAVPSENYFVFLALGASFFAEVFFAGAFFTGAFFAGVFFSSFAAAKLTSETEIASSTRKIKSLRTFI